MEIAEGTSAMHNEPALTRRISAALARSCGQFNVEEANPMGAEDFSEFGKRYEDSIKNGTPLPSLHSSEFAPSPRPTIRTGVAPLTVAEV